MTRPANKTYSGVKTRHVVSVKGHGEATAEQLARINAIAIAELTADQVYVRTAYLAHNAIDRDRDVFDGALLRDFAATLPGKGLFIKHPRSFDGDSGPGVGRWFEARVVEMSLDEARAALKQPNLQWAPGADRAELLEASYFVPRSDKNADLIIDIDAGVASDVSIGFVAADRTGIQDGDGNTIAYRLHAPGEALEGSLVWLGAQPGARTVKDAHRASDEEDDPMSEQMKQQLQDLQQKNADLQQKLDANKAAGETLAAIRKAVGDALTDDTAALVRTVNDGKAYREKLVNDVVNGERQLGMVGDSDEDVASAKSLYQSVDIQVLEQRAKAVGEKVGGGNNIEGGDPGADAGDQQARDDKDNGGEKDYSKPTMNPAITG